MKRIARAPLIQAASIIVFLGLWQIISASRVLFVDIAPSLVDIVAAASMQLATGSLWQHIGVTAYEAMLGFTAAFVLALPMGVLFGANRPLRNVLEPLIVYFAATPKIILYPIFLMMLGAQLGSKVAMAAVSSFFPLVINVTMGAANINGVFVKVARSVGASRLQMMTRVYLPSMLLPIFAGMRLGLGAAVVGAILGELKVSNAGLGFIIIQHFNHFKIADMYASILVTFLFAAALNVLMTIALRRIRKFSPES
jgi:ABC-type nitrate/sulfonate/bicarbonate transport system permease component